MNTYFFFANVQKRKKFKKNIKKKHSGSVFIDLGDLFQNF